MSNTLSIQETLHLADQFLNGAIHLILFMRQVYPPELFREMQLFGVRTHKCRHPQLVDYVSKIVQSAVDQLKSGELDKLIMVIKQADLNEEAVERYVLEFDWLIPQELLRRTADWRPQEAQDGLNRQDVEDSLRAALNKLKMAGELREPLEGEHSWAGIVQLREEVPEPSALSSATSSWVPAEIRHAGGGDDDPPSQPLKRAQLGTLNINLSVEQLGPELSSSSSRR